MLIKLSTDKTVSDAVAALEAAVQANHFCVMHVYNPKETLEKKGVVFTQVFAGGIGENAPLIRTRVCDGLGFIGIESDDARNTENASLISTDAGRVAVRVIRTDEQLIIARSVIRVLGLGVQNER